MSEVEYYIWSEEHKAWWAPNHRGYTTSIAEAGVYTHEQALKILDGANRHRIDMDESPNEYAVKCTSFRSGMTVMPDEEE